MEAAIESLLGHLDWRRDTDVCATVSSEGLKSADDGERLCVLLNGCDINDRPLLFVRPRALGGLSVTRAATDLCIASEIGRRRIARRQESRRILQLSLLVDLQGFGISHFVCSCAL